jgi:hypothetical protein
VIKHPSVQDSGLRGIDDSIAVVAHNTDPESSATTGDSTPIDPEMMSGLGGDGSDIAGATPIVGWAQATAATPLTISLNPAGRVSGVEARMGAGAGVSAVATPPPSSMVLLASLLEIPATGDDGAALDIQGDGRFALFSEPAATDRDSSGPLWADPLDGSRRSDWEAVDGELRHFLSRLGDLVDAPTGRDAGPVWRLWIAAAMVLVFARRASSGPWRLFRRPTPGGAAWASARGPVPIGPWPLGPP